MRPSDVDFDLDSDQVTVRSATPWQWIIWNASWSDWQWARWAANRARDVNAEVLHLLHLLLLLLFGSVEQQELLRFMDPGVHGVRLAGTLV